MANKFYPLGGRQLLDGGLNNKYGPNIIEGNQSPDCLNVIFNAGAVETRNGVKVVNTTSVGSFACDGIYSYRNNTNVESMVCWFGGSAYALSGTTLATIPSAQSVFSSGLRVASEQAENYIFFGNGAQNPYKYNGAFTRHGVYAGTQTATVVSGGAGVLSGSAAYLYGYTYVNTNLVESNLSPLASTFVVTVTSGAQNTVSNIATAPVSYGVNNVYLYRTKNGQTTPYYRVTTMTNGTTSYTDNIPDTSLTIQSPTSNGVPPNYTTICYAQGFLFCNDPANPNRVNFSKVGNPYSFNPLDFVTCGDNTSDTVKGLYYFNNSIVIFCEKSVWFLYLTDATPADWIGPIRSNSQYGSKSPYALVNYNNKILFPAMYNQQFVGFAAFNGNVLDTNKTILTVSSAGSDQKSDMIEPDMFSVNTTYISNISSTIYKKKAWISVTYGSSNSTNNRIYQFDFSMSTLKPSQEATWCPFTGITAAQFCVFNGNLYFGDAALTGLVWQAETGLYNDNGSAINSYFWTKEYAADDEDVEGSDTNLVKDFRWTNVLCDTQGNYNMNVTYRLDSDKGAGTTTAVSLVSSGGSLWGTAVWGSFTWGSGNNQIEPKIYLSSASGKRIQFKFSNQNTKNQKFKVYGLNFTYNPKGYR